MVKFRQVFIFSVVVTLLAAFGASTAGAASATPINADNIFGDPDAGTTTSPSNNIWVNYDEGTCIGQCRFNTHLPGDAAGDIDQVPHPKVSSMYVQTDGDGGFSVCFSTKGVDFPQVWQYVNGQWVLISTSVVNGNICVSGHGSGIFALFGYVNVGGSQEPVEIEQPGID